MKITRKSFQSFFTRASFAGLLLAGVAGAQAQATDAADNDVTLRDFTLEKIFAPVSPVRRALGNAEAAWSPAFTAASSVGDTRSSADETLVGWQDLARSSVSPTASVGPIFYALGIGSLTPTATTYNYSTAPWSITNGTSSYPDGGGTATLNAPLSITPGTLAAATTITVDVSPQLSQINYNSPYSFSFAAGTGTSIIADPTNGLTLNAILTATNSPTNIFTGFNPIASPISGGGSVGLIKTGGGTVTLTGANTYTGGTHINSGLLSVGATAAVGDSVFGAAGAGISFNGGSLFSNVTGGLTTSRPIFLDTNGGTIFTSTVTTLNGVISGPGSLSLNGFGGVQLTLTAANTYTGATITSLSTASYLTLNGNGSIAASSSYDLSGQLNLDNSGTTGVNRISDTAAIAARGVYVNLTGNASAATAETVGAITLADGISTLNVIPGTAGSTLTAASITRQNGGLLVARGTNLGATPGVGNATILSTVAPTLVGGGGAAGTTTQSIVPWAIGNLTASTTSASSTTNSINSGFVTYDATNGFRPLATTEYAAAFGSNLTDNVRLTTATVAPAASIANAVLFAPSAAATLSGGPITITSGAFMYSPTVASVVGTVSAGLNFGTAEGVITATAPLTISGAIAGTGGLTVGSPTVSVITLTGANTYTGTTTLVASQLLFTGAVANDGVTAGPLGLSTTPIVLNAGLGYALLASTANTTFARNLSVVGAASPGLDYFGGVSGLTMNGNIDMQHNLTIYAGTTTATGVVINGVISGPGALQGFGTSTNVTLNGNNTFTGGVNTQGDTYTLGSDTAFGNGGTVYVSAAGTFQGSGTVARTIANPWVTLATPTFAGTAPLTLSGAFNLNGARTFAASNTALTTFSGQVSNGSITKTGTGAVAFNSATGNTFTGGFTNTGLTATSSAIYANNTSGSAFGPGAVNVGASSATVYSTLAGNFSTSGSTSIGGRLSPGNGTGLTAATAGQGSIGTIAFGSTLTLSSATTSSLYLEIGGANSFDRITVAGAFTSNGTFNIATTNGYTIQAGDTFAMITYGSLTAGTVTYNVTGVTLAPGVTLTETFTGTQFIVTAVPEPGTWAAVAIGLGALGGLQFARRRRQS